MLYFNRDNQEKKLLNYLPKGRIYNKAYIPGTAFNKFIKWLSVSFKWLIDKYNTIFKGLYISESSYLIEKWKTDYSIPNKIFYLSDIENPIDIFVLKYLMNGNTLEHFIVIAQAYGVGIKILNGNDYFLPAMFPVEFPMKFVSFNGDINNVLVIDLESIEESSFPYFFPVEFNNNNKLEKIKNIYDIIKPSQCKILYLSIDGEYS